MVSKYFIVLLFAAAQVAAVPQLEQTNLQQQTSLSSCQNDNDTKLYLYTRNNPTTPEVLTECSIPFYFNASCRTYVIVHGWISNKSALYHLVTAYLAAEKPCNIILVDWSSKAFEPYPSAKDSTICVGKFICRVLSCLVKLLSLDLKNVSCIGHSLGAHLCGVIGHCLNGTLGRICGLDPAGPLYHNEPKENRLDKSDACFVMAIHTNKCFLGLGECLGHADFYPNGGCSQPGCPRLLAGAACSHSLSHLFFNESIMNDCLTSTKCSNYNAFSNGSCAGNEAINMGEHTPTNASGKYYLTTGPKPQYCLN